MIVSMSVCENVSVSVCHGLAGTMASPLHRAPLGEAVAPLGGSVPGMEPSRKACAWCVASILICDPTWHFPAPGTQARGRASKDRGRGLQKPWPAWGPGLLEPWKLSGQGCQTTAQGSTSKG